MPNADGGPDFTDALITVGRLLCRGDVELHTHPASWRAHGHDSDPHYNRVILHAVLRCGRNGNTPRTATGRAIPQVVLAPFIDARALRARPARPRERCRTRGARVSPEQISLILRSTGRRKINARVRALGARLSQIEEEGTRRSWNQLLYESLMEGMGYTKNRLPFLTLARGVTLEAIARAAGADCHAAEALLFGEAGLLPVPRRIAAKEARGYVRAQRRRWRRLRRSRRGLLREADWKFFRLRPANFPTARLAAFCRLLPLLMEEGAPERILSPLEQPGAAPKRALRAVEALLSVRGEGFWSRHVEFRRRGGRAALGCERIHDILVNALLPMAIMRGRLAGKRSPWSSALALIEALPAHRVSKALREMKARLGGAPLSGRLACEGALSFRARYCLMRRCAACPALRTSRRSSRERTSTWRRP